MEAEHCWYAAYRMLHNFPSKLFFLSIQTRYQDINYPTFQRYLRKRRFTLLVSLTKSVPNCNTFSDFFIFPKKRLKINCTSRLLY